MRAICRDVYLLSCTWLTAAEVLNLMRRGALTSAEARVLVRAAMSRGGSWWGGLAQFNKLVAGKYGSLDNLVGVVPARPLFWAYVQLGITPAPSSLEVAASLGRISMVRMLLEFGLDPKWKDGAAGKSAHFWGHDTISHMLGTPQKYGPREIRSVCFEVGTPTEEEDGAEGEWEHLDFYLTQGGKK